MADMINSTELSDLEKAVNDASNRVGGLWLSFITLATYLAISVGSVTHRNLLLDTPLKMPLLNVDLPLVEFFVVAPALFVVFLFYLFLQLYGLVQKISEYDKLLVEQGISEANQRLIRHHLDNFIFVQILAGPRYRSDKIISLLLRVIAWITVVATPLFVLLVTEFTFLPYHSEPVTWLHRSLICMDVIIVLFFWPTINGRPRPRGIVPKISFTSGAACAVVLLALVVAIFPGEGIYEYVRTPFTRLLFEGDIDPVTGHAQSWFANRLLAPDQSLIKTEDAQHHERTVSFRGRDLRGAVLSRPDLRNADFTGANLFGAILTEANLEQAWFGCADKLLVRCAELRSADFTGAHMGGAQLDDAKLEGASFITADLHGVLSSGPRCRDAIFGLRNYTMRTLLP